jgi:hypothetical protein
MEAAIEGDESSAGAPSTEAIEPTTEATAATEAVSEATETSEATAGSFVAPVIPTSQYLGVFWDEVAATWSALHKYRKPKVAYLANTSMIQIVEEIGVGFATDAEVRVRTAALRRPKPFALKLYCN